MNAPRILVPCVLLLALCACSRQSAQEKGTALATDKLDLVTGIGNALETKGAAAGESITGGVGTVIRGVERGVMKSDRAIVADPTLAAAGLRVTSIQGDAEHGLEAYVISDSDANGTLRVLAYDVMGREIGRASLRIKRGADEARCEGLPFDGAVRLGDVRKVAFVFKPVPVASIP